MSSDPDDNGQPCTNATADNATNIQPPSNTIEVTITTATESGVITESNLSDASDDSGNGGNADDVTRQGLATGSMSILEEEKEKNNEEEIVDLESPVNEAENVTTFSSNKSRDERTNNTTPISTNPTDEDSDTDPELVTMRVNITGVSYSILFSNNDKETTPINQNTQLKSKQMR